MDKHQRKPRQRVQKRKNRIKTHDTKAHLDYSHLKPIFDIRCDHHKHCLERFKKNVKSQFAHTIHKLGQMTWQQIETVGRESLGYEKMPLSQIKPQPPITLSPDEKIKIFRLTRKERMAGVRLEREVFTVLWIAPKHDLY